MNSTGYEQHPAQIIKEIRGNIRDRYQSGFPILKEVIQNADDADNASEFHFGWNPGLEGSLHPLARVPAIFFLNNGDFAAEHEDGIKSFNYGSKAVDKASVGKFGLGMKSVFHWCEAFFYLYGPAAINKECRVAGKILNPWTGTGKHENWNHCTPETIERIRETLSPIIGKQQFFCLWIPLRRDQDLDKVPPIISEFPQICMDVPASQQAPWGDCTLQLAGLLPLLHRIRKIVYWAPERETGEWKQCYSIQLPDDATQRRSLKAIIPDNVRHKHFGQVQIRALEQGCLESRSYASTEISIDSPILRELHASSAWPIDSGIDPVTYEHKQEKEKGEPHASVSFISLPSSTEEKSTLQFQWAVFLPVSDAETVNMGTGLDFDLRVVLHGYFFLDAGRSRIEGLSETDSEESTDDSSLRTAWNVTLMREGVFPLVIPTFRAWIDKTKASDDVIHSVTKALQISEIIRKNVIPITQELQWLFRLRLDGRGSWESVSAQTQILAIPSPPVSDRQRPFLVFPRLALVCQEEVVTFSDKPLLARDEPSPCSIDIINRLLTDVSIQEIFTKPAYTEYFANFLCAAQLKEHQPPESLRRLLQKVFQTVSLTELGKCRQHLKRLIAELPVSWFVPISDNVPLHEEMIRFAAASGSCPILVPATYLDGDRAAAGDEDTTFRVVQTFADPPEALGSRPEYPESCHQFVTSLLKESSAQKVLGQEAVRNLRVFSARKLSENRSLLLTLNEIADSDEVGSLFTKSQNDLVKQLQEALSGTGLYTVDNETYRYATGKQESYPCSSTNCMRYIDKHRPPLRSPERRRSLLSALLPALDDNPDRTNVRRVCRYLLHGNPAAYESDLNLVSSGLGESSDVWARLHQTVLDFKDAHWCYVNPELTELLTPQHQHRLSLAHADRSNTQRLLVEYQADLPRLCMDSLTEGERDVILEEIHDTNLLKVLPIHRTLEGKLTHIDTTTFLECNVPTCSYVRERTRIVAKHSNPELARRQESFIEVLSAGRVLQIVLCSENPVQHWNLIAEVLSSAKPNEVNASIDALRKSKWIPTRMDGVAVSPSQVLWIPGLESDIDRLQFPEELQYSKRSEIVEELWRHAGMKQHLEKLLPSLEDRLEMLGEVLAKHQEFRLGVQVSDEHQLEGFVEVFRGKAVLLAADIIHRLETKALVQHSQIVRSFLPHLTGALSGQHFVGVLDYLSRESESALGVSKEKFQDWHNRYLESVRESGCRFEVLPHVRLKNRAGRWKPATNLCLNAPGIRREDILNEEQAALLGLEYPASSQEHRDNVSPGETATRGQSQLSLSDIEGEVAQSANTLRDYFRTWADSLPDELIGGFLCFLGDLPEIRSVAEQYLGQRSIEKTREALEWPSMNKPGKGFNETLQESMSDQRFIVRIVPDGAIEVESIAGGQFVAHQSKDVDTIFIGDTFRAIWRDGLKYRANYLDLRPLDPGTIGQDGNLGEVLRTSLEQLFSRVYFRQVSNVDALWEELGESEQLDIAIAQDMLLDSLFLIIRQMGVHSEHSELRDVFDEFDRVLNQSAETNVKKKPISYREDDAKAKESVRQKLVALLEQSSGVQQAILAALRIKMKDYQYSAASIPFELFQNADDALVELLEMRAAILETLEGAFTIVVDGDTIRAMHWGRPINKFREGEFDGRKRGFAKDLEKMLVLSYSDKGNTQGEPKVTGKFGLGFKSVFLITDRPRVKSGRLGFEVVSGFWPRLLSPDEKQELHSTLERFRPDDRNGTLIELPDVATSPREVLSEFRRLSPILVAFSRAITSIRIEGLEAEESYCVAWNPDYPNEARTLLIGQLELTPGDTPSTVLKVNAGEGGLLFKIEPNGFGKMPKEIPTVWVTAPTSECSKLGFAINGPFPLDVGRAQLSRDETSYQTLAREIGREFLSAMEIIYEMAHSDWVRFVEELKMRPDLKPHSFWFSVWKLLVEPFADSRPQHDNNAIRLMREVLWGKDEANLRKLYRERSVIPTGLCHAHSALTRAADIEIVLEGILGRDDVLLSVSSWGSATDLLSPGGVISSSVHEVLHDLDILKEGSAGTLSLVDLLESDTDRGGVVTPEKAHGYGDLINRRFMQCDSLGQKERESLQELLSTYKFAAVDGTAQSSKDLLIFSDPESSEGSETGPEEELRAAFAPGNRVLALAYSRVALDFFRICRREMHAPVAHLVDWALTAQDESRQNAVLGYLLKGRLGRELGESLCVKMTNSWLENFRELPYYEGLDDYQKGMIDALLGVARGQPEEIDLAYPPIPISSPDPGEALQRIYDWWTVHKEEKIHEYVRKTYPSSLNLCLDLDFDHGHAEQRRSWTSLFLLGMTYTMGRTQPEQHRGFLNLLIEKKWLDVFSDERIVADDWIGVLEEFVDKERWEPEQYSEWMKLFPSIYRVSRYLCDYAGAFCAVQEFESAFSLHEITSPRDSARFQGGGFDAPSLSNALGIGGSFVMRELVRNGVLSQVHAYSHCYVPTKRIKDYFSRLGCGFAEFSDRSDSRIIYEFVVEHLGEEKATFDHCFDIPFLFY